MAEPGRDPAAKADSYQCPDDVGWSVEIDTIRLIDQRTGSVCLLGYPEAAIWDLISRGYGFDDLVRLLGVIASISASQAKRLVLHTVEDFVQKGFLTRSDSHD